MSGVANLFSVSAAGRRTFLEFDSALALTDAYSAISLEQLLCILVVDGNHNVAIVGYSFDLSSSSQDASASYFCQDSGLKPALPSSMSKKVREEFEKAQRSQQMRNQARKIRTEVDRAQDNRIYAAKRWPFELLQNAHDTGPRLGRGQIEFSLRLNRDRLVVEHDGSCFTNRDLAALLSGGSSKEYDGEETTGRFGTGFLMTHAISTQPTIKGILKREERGYERFEIQLERSGDEEAIAKNIESSQDAIEAAEPVEWQDIDSSKTAEFIYPLDEDD